MPSSFINSKRKRFASTKGWVQSLMKMKSNHQDLLAKYQSKVMNTAMNDSEKEEGEPINLLIIDGGGMRGYATLPIISAIQESFLPPGRDFIDQFDLIGGTSVGGICSLLFSHHKGEGDTTSDMLLMGRDVIDELREKVFGNISLANLCFCRHTLIDKENEIISVLKDAYNVPLKSRSVPAVAVIASVKKNDEGDYFDDNYDPNSGQDDDLKTIQNREFEPFIARTFEYPEENQDKEPLATSSNKMMLYEGCAATSAVPVLVDRVRIEVDDQLRIFADGMIFQNCPMSLCIDEAQRLYPNRPIGVIVSLGFTNDEDELIQKTIESTRIRHPNLHFQRIVPSHITEDFSAAETDLKAIAKMEARVLDWMFNDANLKDEARVTMEKLCSSAPRGFGQKTSMRRSSVRFDSLKIDKDFMRRSVIRDKAIQNQQSLRKRSTLSSSGRRSFGFSFLRDLDEEFDC